MLSSPCQARPFYTTVPMPPQRAYEDSRLLKLSLLGHCRISLHHELGLTTVQQWARSQLVSFSQIQVQARQCRHWVMIIKKYPTLRMQICTLTAARCIRELEKKSTQQMRWTTNESLQVWRWIYCWTIRWLDDLLPCSSRHAQIWLALPCK